MKTFVKGGLAAGALAATLCTGVFIGQAAADQPRMRDALASLQTARQQLSAAAANKGGHRATAMKYTGMAIDEVRAGIAAGDQ